LGELEEQEKQGEQEKQEEYEEQETVNRRIYEKGGHY